MDNFGNLVLRFVVENNGTITYGNSKTKEDIIEIIQEIKRLKSMSISVDSNIYENYH